MAEELKVGQKVKVKYTNSQFKNALTLVGHIGVILDVEKEFGCNVYLVGSAELDTFAYFSLEQLEVLNG